MNTIWKYLQYGYLVVGAIFLIEAILVFKENTERSVFMGCFAIFITLIFFFKRRFRKKIEQKNNQK